MLKKLPIKIIVAHINHQLRKESDADEKFVENLCKPKSARADLSNQKTAYTRHSQEKFAAATILFASLTANIKLLSQKLKTGLEETGRKIRYDFFQNLAKKHHAKFILTAHHADDNLETIILNFARGASLQGLTGMQEIENINKNSKLFRPLLSISKQQINDFLRAKKIKYHIDKSNESLIYKRNFIRHKIVPLFKEINPNITQTLAKNTENLHDINEFLKISAQNWIKKNSKTTDQKTLTSFDAKSFRLQPKAFQKILLLQIYEKLFGHTQNIQSSNLDEALTLINKNIGNKKKKFGQLTISLKNNIISLI